MAEMTCKELVEVITDYLENTLAPEERATFERHLTICIGCRAYLQQMRETLQMLGRLSEDDIPADVQQDLLATFRGLHGAHGAT
jgi:predicted anti-sigma-YlaC factor YlaD